MAALAHKGIQRRPVGLAKLSERGSGNLRSVLISSSRENDAPMGRSKGITLAMGRPRQSFHVSGVTGPYGKGKPREKLQFRAAPLPDPLCKGKANHPQTQPI